MRVKAGNLKHLRPSTLASVTEVFRLINLCYNPQLRHTKAPKLSLNVSRLVSFFSFFYFVSGADGGSREEHSGEE